MELTVDGVRVEGQRGETVLTVARRAGAEIPALCAHPAVAPYGACRLCMVEVKRNGRSRMVASCSYPAEDGLTVLTRSERVQHARRGVLELLLARAPESEELQALGASLGVEETRFQTIGRAEGGCILCGLCVSVCRDVIHAASVSFANRGVDRELATPFLQPSEECIGCGACAAVCPVGAIGIRVRGDEIRVEPFGNRVRLARCAECGTPIGSVPLGERIQRGLGDHTSDAVGLCIACKQRLAAERAWKVARLHVRPKATSFTPTASS